MDEPGAADGLLSGRLADVARSLQAEPSTAVMLDEVVAAAVRMIPGAQEASISFVAAHREVRSAHPSSELARVADEVQTDVGQGPGLDAIWEQRTVRVPNMHTEARWPLYARRVSELGVGSLLSFRLFVHGDDLGALNLFSRDIDAFTEESEQIGLAFASHAAVAFAGARNLDNLTLAVDGRDLIGQAKGILMERYAINSEQAFMVLLRASQTAHRKLSDLASKLVSTGRLEGIPRGD